jgi:hypothetical protein
MPAKPAPVSPGPMIFLSYRRDDSGGHVGRLYDALSAHFGSSRLFVDIDHISPGQDFVQVVDDAVTRCAILLVVMGKRWAGTGRVGKRRIDSTGDFVRLEVAGGLKRAGLRVMPVLVGGAAMLSPTDLPEDIRELARRNAIELSDTRWKEDVARLISELDRALGPAVTPSTARSALSSLPSALTSLPKALKLPASVEVQSPKTWPPWMKWTSVGAAVIVVGLIARSVFSHSTGPATTKASIPSQLAISPDAPTPLPAQLAKAGQSALSKAQAWRSDAILTQITARLLDALASGKAYEVDYTFRSPADGAGLVVVTGGPAQSTVRHLPAAGGALVKPLPSSFVDLPAATATARDSGMLGDVRSALLSSGFGGRVGQPTWMLKGNAGDSYRPYYVDAATGAFLHGTYRDPNAPAASATKTQNQVDPIGAIKGFFNGGKH